MRAGTAWERIVAAVFSLLVAAAPVLAFAQGGGGGTGGGTGGGGAGGGGTGSGGAGGGMPGGTGGGTGGGTSGGGGGGGFGWIILIVALALVIYFIARSRRTRGAARR